uniref:Putative enoyl-coa hydratase/isomerase n=1 Tax=Lutzomyia longipalpis TaxID=7200 RepID=A0A7G3AIH7_LUTLO
MAMEFDGIPGDLANESQQSGKTDSDGNIIMQIPIETPDERPDGENNGNERHFPDMSDEQMNPMSSLKAVPMMEVHESLLSDDETKILTTLEPVKKKQQEQEEANGGKVQHEDNADEEEDDNNPESIARKQLESLNSLRRKGRPKADEPKPIDLLRAHASKKIHIIENRVLPTAEDFFAGLKNINERTSRSLQSNILTREELTKEIIQKCRKSAISIDKVPSRMQKRRDEVTSSTGTIEIPQELILSADDSTPVIVQETESLEGQDLLAILEGDDDDGQETSVYELQSDVAIKAEDDVHVEEYTISFTDSGKQQDLDKEKEIEIAMKQIMSLPVKSKKGRPRRGNIGGTSSQHDSDEPQKSKITSASDLISSLVSDWSDNEDKADETILKTEVLPPEESEAETTVRVVISPADAPQPTPLKSSRIIKKKVIWDPDAPETQISYASKVQGSARKSRKLLMEEKAFGSPTKPVKKSPTEEVKQPKRPGSAASMSGAKKKKLSEVDKLLGDEGAVNMIYSLERENNNTDVPEIETKPDKNQMVSKSKERTALVARAKAVKNVVIKMSDTAPSGAPRGRPKREPSSTHISPPTQIKKVTPTKKRNSARESATSSTASESWDFLYSSSQGDDSMIIRRRSNSSYSGSTTSPRRLSIDQHQEESGRKGDDSFEFAKPENKKTPKIDSNTAHNLVADLKGKLNMAINRGNCTIRSASASKTSTDRKESASLKVTKDHQPIKLRASERKLGHVDFKEITIRRYDNFVQLIFSPTYGVLKNVLTIALLREVKTALGILKDDSKCKLVLVTSSGNNFCQGIDISGLIQTTADKRKAAAQQLSTALRDFLEALATFPKPLLAGVHGTVSDLGVTMLPLFDVVLSSEAAVFCTNYAKIGQIPEANAVLNLSGKVSAKGITLLLLLCESLSAKDACEYGLVTKTLWPDNFQDLLMENAKTISFYSLQCDMAMEFDGIPGDLANESQQSGKTDSDGNIIMQIPIETPDERPDGENNGNERHFPDMSDEQMNPMSSLKAVPMMEVHESLLSDDETKILTTLEPVKKKQQEQEEANGGKVQHEDNADEEEDDNNPESIARKQLESLNSLRRKGRPKADEPKPIDLLRAHASKKIHIIENRVLPTAEDFFAGLKNINERTSRSLQSNILTREELTKEIIQKCRKSAISIDKVPSRMQKRRDEVTSSTGTIEIPQELILSADDSTPVIVQETESLEGQDLLAILEGDDDDGQETSVYELQSDVAIKAEDDVHVEEYTISFTDSGKQQDLDKEKEIEIAMKQIMSLPVKSKKGRPRRGNIGGTSSQHDSDEPQKSKITSASDLISSLVSDWSDNEDKADETILKTEVLPPEESEAETTVRVVISPADAPQPTPLKSSRIIKKKVIWDPDAPETQISYASKVQGSARKSRKLLMEEKAFGSPTKPVKKSPTEEVKQPKRPGSAASMSGAKKKKLSEVDKLLGDEGAVNMIYSLERENNNTDVPEIETKPDKNQMVSKSKERTALVARAKAVKNVVIKMSDTAPSGAPRGRPKREPSSTHISPPTQIKKVTPTKKRNSARESATSSTASESWDFLYSSSQGDGSMIIRRRSNSSYSGSTTSPRRLSIDQHQEESGRKGDDSFEFAKPENKKTPKIDSNTAHNTHRKESASLKVTKDHQPIKLRASERKLGHVDFKEITIRRYDNFVQLIFSPTYGVLKNVLTTALLREVKTALGILKDDSKCKLVLVTSSGNNFCQGIDISGLIQTTADKRKAAAQQLSTALRDFLEALATFPKPLLAGVHGTVSDLGVTMLPLFDVVLSSEAAVFCTNYAKIGQIPEANAVLNLSGKVSAKGITLLLLLCESLSAKDACEYGLVTKTLWPDNFQDLLMENAKTISFYHCRIEDAFVVNGACASVVDKPIIRTGKATELIGCTSS